MLLLAITFGVRQQHVFRVCNCSSSLLTLSAGLIERGKRGMFKQLLAAPAVSLA